MKLVQATESDSDRLIKFFSSTELSGRVDLRFERHNSFFDIYKIASDDFKTYFIENDKNEIHGMATLTFHQAYINGEVQRIGFARDLRLSPLRKAHIEWPKHYLQILKKEIEPESKDELACKYFFSSISTYSDEAYKMLVRPNSSRRAMPRYYLLRKYHIVALHGKIPLISSPISGIKISHANLSDLEALAFYLDQQAKARHLAPVFTTEILKNTINSWPGLELDDFILAKDSDGNIIGSCAPWSPSNIQSTFPLKYHGIANQLYKLLSWGSPLGITHSLPKPNFPLDLSFLTHFFANNPDIFYSLLFHAWKNSRKSQTLLYPDFFGHHLTLPPQTFIHTKTPYSLYTVMPPNHSLPSFFRPRLNCLPPYIEPALL